MKRLFIENMPDNMHDDPGFIAFVRSFYRHLVALCVTFTAEKPGDETPSFWFRTFAGTLLRVQGQAYFLTAGHILKSLYEGKENGVRICGVKIVDSLGPNAISREPIPFDLLNEQHFYIDEPKEGLDFGVIPLRQYYTRLLEANNLEFIDERNFRDVPIDHDAYFMMGFPAELTSPMLSEAGTAEFEPVTISIQKTQTLPQGMTASRNPPFVGKIDPGPFQSIEGMSGGPIVGLKDGSPARYWIIAIQSAWIPARREVIGCPLDLLFLSLIEHQRGIIDASTVTPREPEAPQKTG